MRVSRTRFYSLDSFDSLETVFKVLIIINNLLPLLILSKEPTMHT
jgi:hypothetical protein